MTSSLFQGDSISELYRLHRPKYPPELYERVLSYMKMKLSPSYHQAVDVGCGSGQATWTLAPYFNHVTGVDISQSQIEEANAVCQVENVKFKIGSADSIPFPDGSCDLVLCMEAAHWFVPLTAFYQEADRVLKPGGCLVVGGYGRDILNFTDGDTKKDLTPIFYEFHNDPLVQKHMQEGNREIDRQYAGWRLIYEDQERFDDMEIVQNLSVDQYLGMLMSRSYVNNSLLRHPGKDHPLNLLRKRLLDATNQALSPDSDDVKLTVTNPMFVLLGRKKVD